MDTPPLPTTVIGSWPKPAWLSEPSLDVNRWQTDLTWRFEGEELKRKQDEATEWALYEQEATGVDIVTDGEIRRKNYVHYYCRNLYGFDFEHRARKTVKAGSYELVVPTISGPITPRKVSLPADYQFVRERTNRQVKMTIPGPVTIMDFSKDQYYGDDTVLAMELAGAIRTEVEALRAVGCKIIQFDEPSFLRYPDKVLDYGLRALEACFAGITDITTVVHICCGLPSDLKDQPKANQDDYSCIAPALALSNIDQISIEGAHRSLDARVLREFGNKEIIFGVVDIGNPHVETVEHIESHIKRVLHGVGSERLLIGLDCGMIYLDPPVAKSKLTNLVEATRRVREYL